MVIKLRLLLLFALCLIPAAALAAEPVYPTGSRIGLTPPPGLTVSHSFLGFEDRKHQVAIVLAALPHVAYAAIDRQLTADVLNKQGVTVETRENLTLAAGKGVLVIGRQQAKDFALHKWIVAVSTPKLTALLTIQIPDKARSIYPDAAVRAALATLAVRDHIPVAEELQLLPFRMQQLAGFRIGGLLAGRAVLLTDGATDTRMRNTDTHIVVAVGRGGPTRPEDRDDFAREVFRRVPEVKEVRISASEPLRINGLFGHQIMAQAKDAKTDADLKIVQWIRFGGGAYLHLVGIARSEVWLKAYARFRKVRDGIAAR